MYFITIKKLFFEIVIFLIGTMIVASVVNIFSFTHHLILPLIVEIFVLLCGFLFLLRRVKQGLINPLDQLVCNLNQNRVEQLTFPEHTVSELKNLLKTLKKITADIRKKAQYEAESIAAKQVAHDICSPLACLNLLSSDMAVLPEQQRILVRSAIQRITDIVNILHHRS